MKIFVYTSVHNWNDSRIFHKEIRSLAREHQLEYHAPAEFKEKVFENIKILGLPQWKSRKDRVKTYFIIVGRLLRSHADVYHFHDPELIITALIPFLKRKKVIFDVHENIVKQIRSKDNLSNWKKRLYAWLYRILEKLFNRTITHFILAESSYQKQFDVRRSTTIFNFPIFQDIPVDKTIKGKLVYVGNWIQYERGAFELVKALGILKERNIDFEMNWIGDFPVNSTIKQEILIMIEELDIKDSIKFLGRIDYKEIFSVIVDSNAGYSCLHPVENFLESYPTKIFEYMMCGVPVVCSDFPLWKEVVEKNNCGYCVGPKNVIKIAQAFQDIIQNKELAFKMGHSGKQAIKEYYNWEKEENKLLNLYRNLI